MVGTGGELRAWRRSRRLTVRELATAFRRASGQRLPAALDQMIRSWERGDHAPSEMYEHLYAAAGYPGPASTNGTAPHDDDPGAALERARHAPGRAGLTALQVAALRAGRDDVAELAETLLLLQRQVDAARERLEELLGEDIP